ncbi:MAG: GldG family protein [Pseudomonadota bacterium]
MEVTPKSRLHVRLQNILFVVLFLAVIGMAAWLSTRYNYQADWSAGARNTLSAASQELLKKLSGPVMVTAYARENEQLRRPISDLLSRYRRYKSDIHLSFVNPDSEPQRVRELGITVDGELVIQYAGRTEKLQELNEQGLTNALQRVARTEKRVLAFITGHGERDPHGAANHDLGNWVRQLENKGLSAQTVNLVSEPRIPQDTTALVIAGPQTDLLPGEVKLIEDYVAQGGNLLWLHDPGAPRGLAPLAERLGVEFQPGVIVDPTTQLLGIERPDFALVGDYPPHSITRNFNTLTLFPTAAAIDLQTPEGWEGEAFLVTQQRSWSESGALQGEITLDQGKDIAGPLNIAVALTRATPDATQVSTQKSATEQRIVVTGDGDFLSNTYLGNGGNLELGLNIVNWLSHDDALIAISARTAPDTRLTLSDTASLFIGFGFLFVLPLALVGAGLTIWLKRRKR